MGEETHLASIVVLSTDAAAVCRAAARLGPAEFEQLSAPAIPSPQPPAAWMVQVRRQHLRSMPWRHSLLQQSWGSGVKWRWSGERATERCCES
jgi:hypothetical protein